MTLTTKTTSSIASGIRYSSAANGDMLWVAPNIYWGSDNNFVVQTNHTDVNLTIEGALVSGSGFGVFNLLNHRTYLTLTETATATANAVTTGIGGVYFGGNDNVFSNAGELNALQTIALLCAGTTHVNNSGTIRGSSGVFFWDDPDQSLINSGLIEANAWQDGDRDERYNNGVMAETANARIVNLETGVISAISTQGAGVRLRGDAGNSYVNNHGEILSLQWWGVDFSDLAAGRTAVLANDGYVSGGAGAFDGSANADTVANTGLMEGNLQFGLGADAMRNGGVVNGNVILGGGNDSYNAFDGGYAAQVDGQTGDDIINGSSAGDSFDGGDGNDTLRGRGGDDTLEGGAGNDIIVGGRDDDRVIGGGGNDRMWGGQGDDTVLGQTGSDTLHAGPGEDRIDGGAGLDTMFGGLGTDAFVFSAASHSGLGAGADRILDFTRGQDWIDLSAVAGNLSFIGTAVFSGTPGEVRYWVDPNGHARVAVDVDGDTTADMHIWVEHTATLDAGDFLL